MTHDPFSLDDLDDFAAPPFDAPVTQHAPAYLEGLNEPQRAAVLNTDGPVLVLAGAGTGKTRALTTRITHLLDTGAAAPWQILSVTFTNKAAKEMQERIAKLIGRPVEGMWIGTFHSVCVRMLRRHAELVGLSSNFTILDTDDQIRLLKQLIEAEGIDHKRWPAKQMAGLIDRWKNRAQTPDKVPPEETHAFADGKGGLIYKKYQERLKVINACDFGDLLLLCITLLQNNPDVLADYHRQFRYILVDEYQDTNVAQYLWLRLLAQAHKNICCVGDDDQSIYGWRGAEVGNILRFEKDFPGAAIIRLEQNYRSTGNILAAASALIAANENRLGKTLWTESDAGEVVRVRGVWDAHEEARTVCEEIESWQVKGEKLNEMAILVRAGFQTREFEERLLTLGLPYKIVGGQRFYERAEIRDAMAYLRVIAQPDDDLAFERIINVPKRSLGPKAVQTVHEYARLCGTSMTRAARDICGTERLRPQARRALSRLLDDFDRWRAMATTFEASELVEMMLDESGYTEMWKQDKSPDSPGRLDNLKELVSAVSEFENLAGFLEHISLVMDNDDNATVEKVSLMTLHAAKGLEFNTVFLPGWEEEMFPSQRSLEESGMKGLEEERRLAYVGITRARVRAYILFAANRQVFGQWRNALPSRFVQELPEDVIDVQTSQGLHSGGPSNRFDYGDDNDSYFSGSGDKYGPGWARAQERRSSGNNSGYYSGYYSGGSYSSGGYGDNKYGGNSGGGYDSYNRGYGKRDKVIDGEIIPPRRKPRRRQHTSGSITPEASKCSFAIGERVFHDKFGYGIIEDIEGNKVEVAFDKAGTKRLVDRFLTLADEV